LAGDYQGPARARGKQHATIFGKIVMDKNTDHLTVSHTDGGSAFVEFTVVVSDLVKGVEVPTFYKCTLWGAGEGGEKYLHFVCGKWEKNKPITVIGKQTHRAWINRDGIAQPGPEIRVADIFYEPNWDQVPVGGAPDDSNYGQLVGAAAAKAPAIDANADPNAW